MTASQPVALRSRTHLVSLFSASIAVATLVLLVVPYVMLAIVPWPQGPGAPALWFDAVFSGLVVTFGGTGTLLATKVSRNAIGWLMQLIGLSGAISLAGGTYAGYNVDIAHGTAPLADFITWLGNWLFTPAIVAAFVFVPLLFPTGRLPSPSWRWRAFAAVGVAAISAISLRAMFGPWAPEQYPGTPNPYQLHGLVLDVIMAAGTISDVTGPPALLIVAASLVLRFRRSRGVERQQYKWFAYAGILVVVTQIVSNLTSGPVSDSLFIVGIVILELLPIAIGVAILRYRLYDIDVVINRTIVYGLLVVVLAAVYAVSVLTLETVLSPITQTSSLSVAVSTLVVAALFDPVRRRVRTVVDRRFYRRRYDAAREIAGFGSRLRDEVEPHRLAVAIAATLDRTVEPVSASIWVRETAER